MTNCSVCNRNNAAALSVCPSCGAMIHDTVREELVPKISPKYPGASKWLKADTGEIKPPAPKSPVAPAPTSPASPKAAKTPTNEMTRMPNSPTLIEFHNKNTAVPEWRLQIQNHVRQRQERGAGAARGRIDQAPGSAARVPALTSGANALKTEAVEQPRPTTHKNQTLSDALERIQKSRRQFLEPEKAPETTSVAVADDSAALAAPPKASKNYPFYIAGKTNEANFKPAEINPPISAFAKPKLAAPALKEDAPRKLDTNKLPPLPLVSAPTAAPSNERENLTAAKIETAAPAAEIAAPKIEIVEKLKVDHVETVEPANIEATETVEDAEIFDDCAPFAMRFNAGLFDLIIGSFVSLLLLAPFVLFGGDWLSIAGAFAFIVTCAIVMFIYLTTSIGFFGRTVGMRLFGLEIIDIENEEYPTFHQAAVNSAVYLLSLALGGIGFLTLPFNEDRRAVHDLVSGTLMVRE